MIHIPAIQRSFYSIQWRVRGYWKDSGGVDGVEWTTDLDFHMHGGWHPGESWREETGRGIPLAVLNWLDFSARILQEKDTQERAAARASMGPA